jgi:hypothetical protein
LHRAIIPSEGFCSLKANILLGAQTKRSENNIQGKNFQRSKHQAGQNIQRDKTFEEKTSRTMKSVGQNIRGDKTSVGTKHPEGQNIQRHHIHLGYIFYCQFMVILLIFILRKKQENP